MPTHNPIAEFRAAWLPHVTKDGLSRLIELLGKGSPFLIHGAFTKTMPMGCLASHIAWNHPQTCKYQHEAGVLWLSRVAKLNPATSSVILAWDCNGTADFALRSDLLEACLEERHRRVEESDAHELAFC